MQVWFSWLIKFPFAFHPWEQAENPANKNLIIHSKIIQLLNKNLKTNISASEWMTLVSAVIPLLDSECDSALPGPLQFLCFLGAVKKMAKCALSGENVHQWLQGWDQRGSHTGKESTAGADAVNGLCLIWVRTSSARSLLFPSCGHTPNQHRCLARLLICFEMFLCSCYGNPHSKKE